MLPLSKKFLIHSVVPIKLTNISITKNDEKLTLIAYKNSLKLIVLDPSLSKNLTKTPIYSVFKLIPKSLKPDSSSAASSVLFLLLSRALNT